MAIINFPQNTAGKKKKESPAVALSVAAKALAALQRKEARKKEAAERREREEKLYDAQELIFEAWDAPTSSKAKALAKKALKISADCADAYTLLASLTRSDLEALALLKEALAVAERTLGPKSFKEMKGEFWGFIETRPYMRALEQLGVCYEALEQREEAASCYRRMLELNPNDNQGARHLLLPLLLILGLDEEAEVLLTRYKKDPFAQWAYGRVLLDFRKHGGEAAKTVASLEKALKVNPHVADLLTGHRKLPKRATGGFTLGSEEEAAECARSDVYAWKATPGAVHWLKVAVGT